jgi:hypothetical protein
MSPLPDYDVIATLGRAARLVSIDGEKAVLKSEPASKGLLGRISRAIVGGSAPFRNEIAVNREFAGRSFRHFLFPRLLQTYDGSHMLFEYVEGEDFSQPTGQAVAQCLDALFELNTSGLAVQKGPAERLVFWAIEHPSMRILRLLWAQKYGVGQRLNVVKLLCRFHLTAEDLGEVTLHNDLMFVNRMMTRDNRIVWLDFEDMLTVHHWVLVDAVDVLFDRERCTLDLESVEAYWRRFLDGHGKSFSRERFALQVRVCLLRHILFARRSALTSDAEGARLATFFATVLDDQAFDHWMAQAPQGRR